jgi:hypothetical protein
MSSQDVFDKLKQRFQPALRVLEQEGAAIQLMNVQDERFIVRASVKGIAEKDRIIAAFRQLDPSLDNVHVDIRVEGEHNVTSTGQSSVQTSQDFSQQGEMPPGDVDR